MLRLVVALAALVSIAFASARGTDAEHEIFYRYTILGYVRDAKHQPLPGRAVELIRDKTGFSYLAETDREGLFVIIARLGDESVGEPLTLKIGEARTTVIARFEPANHRDERGTRVDLEAARFVDRAASFQSTLTRFLGTSR